MLVLVHFNRVEDIGISLLALMTVGFPILGNQYDLIGLLHISNDIIQIKEGI